MDAGGFRAWRKGLRLTQAEAGKRLHCSTRMIKHYEAGTRRITSRVEQQCSDVRLRRRLYIYTRTTITRRMKLPPRRNSLTGSTESFTSRWMSRDMANTQCRRFLLVRIAR